MGAQLYLLRPLHHVRYQLLYGIAIDGSGNAWTSDYANSYLGEWIGVAAPVATPLSVYVGDGTAGTLP
jgi:hypothetical protein